MPFIVKTSDGMFLAKCGEAITEERAEAFEFETKELAQWHADNTNVFGSLKVVEECKCKKCGHRFESWFDGVKTVTVICSSCAVINLAEFLETPLPGDSLKRISESEQLGAKLRAMAKPRRR